MLNRWNFLKPGFYEGINIRGFSILSLLTTDRTSSRVLELALETLKLLLFLAVVGAALFLATRAGEAQSSGISISGTNNSELTISVSDPSSDFGDSLHPSGIDSTSSDTVADYQGNQGNQGSYYVWKAAGGTGVDVEVKSNKTWSGTIVAAENIGSSASMTISSGVLKYVASSEPTSYSDCDSATPFSASTATWRTGEPPGKSTFTYYYCMRVDWDDDPGTFASSVTYTATQS